MLHLYMKQCCTQIFMGFYGGLKGAMQGKSSQNNLSTNPLQTHLGVFYCGGENHNKKVISLSVISLAAFALKTTNY